MRSRALAVSTALLAGVSFWWAASQQARSPRAAARIGDRESAAGFANPVGVTTDGTPGTGEHTPDEARPTILPGPVEEQPKPTPLAARGELPIALEDGQNDSGLTPLVVLENLRSVFRQYHQRFGANPVGDNAEITASLNGQNPRQATFLHSDSGLQVNSRGELVDNWGTPFFFHQLSRTEMEIHSAGPDLKMWSQDDLVLK